jgi:bifunctional ADP-heptose synthase (sugar kinase/adenylyltransferase)
MSNALSCFNSQRLGELVRRFPSLRVLVFGDFFLDKYFDLDSTLEQLSLETGKIAYQVVGVRHSPGAAGTVVNNLAALGVKKLMSVGFTGDDGEGYELRADLAALGCETKQLHIDAKRRTSTYMKPCDVDKPGLGGEHNRYDIKNRSRTEPWLEECLAVSLDSLLPKTDVLIVIDQIETEGTGAVTSALVNHLAEIVPRFPKLVAWADSRRRIMSFRNLTLKMNQFELVGMNEPAPGSIMPAKDILAALPKVEAHSRGLVFITAAEQGVWVGGPSPLRVPAVRVDVPVDPTGAGDSFTAGAALSLAAGASPAEAALVGNLVASITVRQLGTTGIARPDELESALDLWMEQNR